MEKGQWIDTPRFLKVQIEEVFLDNNEAWEAGYTEPTHYRDSEWHVRGKSTGKYTMAFAAIKRD